MSSSSTLMNNVLCKDFVAECKEINMPCQQPQSASQETTSSSTSTRRLTRVHADPHVQDRVQLLCRTTPVAQHSSVDVTSSTTVAGRLAGAVALGLWQRDARRSTRPPAKQTTVCDERCRATCLLCTKLRTHQPATL